MASCSYSMSSKIGTAGSLLAGSAGSRMNEFFPEGMSAISNCAWPLWFRCFDSSQRTQPGIVNLGVVAPEIGRKSALDQKMVELELRSALHV